MKHALYLLIGLVTIVATILFAFVAVPLIVYVILPVAILAAAYMIGEGIYIALKPRPRG